MSRCRRVGTILRGIAALITLLVLVVGLPLLLVRLGGSPIPRHILGWHQLERALLRRDNGTIFFGAVRDISWIAWAAFTVAVLAEALAALRGRNAPRLGLGGLQATAGRLVALAILTFSGPGGPAVRASGSTRRGSDRPVSGPGRCSARCGRDLARHDSAPVRRDAGRF